MKSGRPLPPQAVDNGAFESFQADWIELENVRDVIGRRERVGVAEADQRSMLRARNQPGPGLEHDDAGAFGADERPGDVESILGKQLIEVVSRHAPGNIGKPAANQAGVAVANRAQRGVDLSAASAGADDRLHLLVARAPDLQLGAVV